MPASPSADPLPNYPQAASTALRRARASVAVAESCTGGGLGAALTVYPGSSEYFLGGILAYANSVKEQLLGVPRRVLELDGAVSRLAAIAMAEGVRARLKSDFGVAVTGVAGPDGGTERKPVGLVWIAVAGPGQTTAAENHFSGTRSDVRRLAVRAALELLLDELTRATQ